MKSLPILTTLCVALLSATSLPCQADELDFVHDVVPILRQHCEKCHGGEEAEGGFSINSRSSFIDGGATPGNVDESRFMQLVLSQDPDQQMPPKDLPRVSEQDRATLISWVRTGLPWTDGYTFAKNAYQPPLLPRDVVLPPSRPGREHPIDRLLDKYLLEHQRAWPDPVDDAAFIRRAFLDLTGLLPDADKVEAYLDNDDPGKRQQLVDDLLSDNVAYAEHWLTFWNDWLRNDYDGTGFITGGRKQISSWLYKSLIGNLPYDEFARQLIAPRSDESRGFIDGIKWRGTVSAGQSLEIQFAQSVAQTFLGINMKCASCHDSFIDSWKLSDAYALAAIYARQPLMIHRCDKPTGETAKPAWLFAELGEIDPVASRDQRLTQLSQLMTDQDNGRFSRTVVNRLWAQLMGRGIVHPLDAMHTRPWNEELLDYLANYLTEHDYDLKAVLRLIATSDAYASRSEIISERDQLESDYVYAGPRAKRMTAEQYLDAVWKLTGQAPLKFDAPLMRGDFDDLGTSQVELSASWIWHPQEQTAKQNVEHLVFRKELELTAPVQSAMAAISADNEFELYVGNRRRAASKDWTVVESVALQGALKKGKNTIVVVARNLGDSPAGLFFQMHVALEGDQQLTIASDDTWQVTRGQPQGGREGRLGKLPAPWVAAVVQEKLPAYAETVDPQAKRILATGAAAGQLMVRASLLKSNFLMRSLGRPNRDQIVTSRPAGLTTLEAIDLSNHETLATIISGGAGRWSADYQDAPGELVDQLFLAALARRATPGERQSLLQALGDSPSVAVIEDVLWAVFVMPEFMIIR